MKISNEMKTGVFVLICIAALLGTLIKIGSFNLFSKGYTIKTRFNFSGGIKKSSPVCLSGVNVGEVQSVRLVYEGNETVAETVLWLQEGTQVRKDSIANVATLGMMGEKYVEIHPGSTGDVAQPGDLIPGQDPVRMEDLIDIGKKVAGDIGGAAQEIGKTSRDISKVVNRVDGMIEDSRPKIDNIVSNLEETSENFNDFSQDVKYHPWKVLAKGKEVPRDQMLKDREAMSLQKAGKYFGPAR